MTADVPGRICHCCNLTLEDDHPILSASLEAARRRVTSAIALYEATLALSRKNRCAIGTASADVDAFLQRVGADVLAINEDTGSLALRDQARFGKAVGHPARLNMGDCFAYAMAKQHRVPLLYKGDDFVRTDLA